MYNILFIKLKRVAACIIFNDAAACIIKNNTGSCMVATDHAGSKNRYLNFVLKFVSVSQAAAW